MQKANSSDAARERRPLSLRGWSRLTAGLLAVGASQWLLLHPAYSAPAAEDGTTASTASMQQIIEAARRKKAQELEAAARRMLGADVSPAPSASAAPLPALAPSTPRSPDTPRVWSLTGVGQKLDAELFYQGRIYRVTLAGSAPAAQVGPWRVRAIQPSGVSVALTGARPSDSRSGATLFLPAPARGSSLAGYSFAAGAVAAETASGDYLSGHALPPSAMRAGQLPLSAPVALSALPQGQH